MKFFKKETDFFELFDMAGRNICRGSRLLLEAFEDFEKLPEKSKELAEVEHENDLITHDIIRKLNQTFLTPIDREDIHHLATRSDDILDLMWSTAQRAQIFKLRSSTPEAVALARTLDEAVGLVYKALTHLRQKKYSSVQDLCIEIHTKENLNDKTFREALGKMFEEEKDPILIIKLKEIYEDLEMATDRCEDVANIFESIVLKYG